MGALLVVGICLQFIAGSILYRRIMKRLDARSTLAWWKRVAHHNDKCLDVGATEALVTIDRGGLVYPYTTEEGDVKLVA